MSKKYKFTQQHMTGGNRCFGNLATGNGCQQTTDTSQYLTPCQSLPLDSGFNQKAGSEKCQKIIDVSQYLTPCQSLPLDSGFNQKAGGKYNYIVNPKTGRKVIINGKIGKQILRKYLYNVQKKLKNCRNNIDI